MQLYQNRTNGEMQAEAMDMIPAEQRPVISSKGDNAVPMTHTGNNGDHASPTFMHSLSHIGPGRAKEADASAHMV